MNKTVRIIAWLAACCCPLLLFGDQITLKNGDRLSGSILKADEKNLVIKAEYGGAITVPFDAVTSIVSSQPLHFVLKDGQAITGTASTSDGNLNIQTKDAGTVTAAKTTVTAIRSSDEQAAYEAELDHARNPRVRDLWSGFVDAGLAAARGNADTTTFNLNMNAARTTTRDKLSVYFTSIYSKTNTTGVSLLTAEANRGGVAYNLNLNPKTFVFGTTDLEEDQFQKLDLRFVGGGGFGWHAIKNERTTLDLSGGGAVNREFFSTGLNRTSGEALLGEEVNYKMSKITTIHQKLVLFPNVTDRGQFRMTFDAGAVTTIAKWLGWQVSVSDRYLTDPVPGTKTNDLLISTGVRVTFPGKAP